MNWEKYWLTGAALLEPAEVRRLIEQESSADERYVTETLRRDGMIYAHSATEHHQEPFTQFRALDEQLLLRRTLLSGARGDEWRRAKKRADLSRKMFA